MPPGLVRRILGAALRGPPPRDLLHHRARDQAAAPEGPLGLGRHVVFDLETTGLRPTHGDAIVAIGAVAIEDGAVAEEFLLLANPGRRIPVAASRHHGITDADVATAPPVSEALARFRAFCDGARLLVAHNAAFDRTALFMAELRDRAPPVQAPVLCSLLAARWLDPGVDDHSLDAACVRHGVALPAQRHDALSDARATAALWLRLIDRARLRGIGSPAELARRAGMERAMLEQMDRF
ncbi:MAG: 3'-5' exonuclease [Acetobacteraceae bacterium]|nr:3'-5' exonuclease [Acetobacteraceae bacterium]